MLQYIGLLVTITAKVCSVVLFHMQVFFDFCNNHITTTTVKGEININQTTSLSSLAFLPTNPQNNLLPILSTSHNQPASNLH
jgi:hypothetical protein